MKRMLVPLVVLTALLAGCGGTKDRVDGGAQTTACTSTPAPIASPTSLPTTFPNPVSVTYTSAQTLGPTQVIEGYTSTAFEEAYERYKSALATGGYSVTKSEKEQVDAEVNYDGNSTTGQVKLVVDCTDRTSVRITIRPA